MSEQLGVDEQKAQEIFGLLGYKDAKRFFGDVKQDPEKAQENLDD